MNRYVRRAAMLACVLVGCSRGLGPDANPTEAGPALQKALEAWKGGATPAELEKQTPSILMNEPDWHAGKRLVDFKMGEPAMYGRQVRCKVQMTIEDKAGQKRQRDVNYIIDTTPRLVIVRDDLG